MQAMAEAHLARGTNSESMRLSVRACELGQALGDSGIVCEGLLRTAAVLRTVGDLPTAVTTLEQAEALAMQAGDTLRLARVLRILGTVTSMLGRHQQALSTLNEAALHLRAPGDEHDLHEV